MNLSTIVAFLAVPIAVNALECDPHPDPAMADAACSSVDPCEAENPCFGVEGMQCCEKEVDSSLFCCGSIDGIDGINILDDTEGGDDAAEAPTPAATATDPAESPTPAETDSAAPKESAIAAAVGMALVGAALL